MIQACAEFMRSSHKFMMPFQVQRKKKKSCNVLASFIALSSHICIRMQSLILRYLLYLLLQRFEDGNRNNSFWNKNLIFIKSNFFASVTVAFPLWKKNQQRQNFRTLISDVKMAAECLITIFNNVTLIVFQLGLKKTKVWNVKIFNIFDKMKTTNKHYRLFQIQYQDTL